MIYRIDVRAASPARDGSLSSDPLGQAVRHQIREFGDEVGPITTSRIFLIDTDAPRGQLERAARELLADPIVEQAELIEAPVNDNGRGRIEIHLKPGVMDPVAASTEMALRDLGLSVREVRTGRAYLIEGAVPRGRLEHIASRVLANGVIEAIHFDAFVPERFETGRGYRFELRRVSVRELSDEQLVSLSRQAHLFLSLAEMRAIQAYFHGQDREPTDVELETIAQTWSEHCVHKTLKSAVEVEVRDSTGKVLGTRRYGNLIKETIFASTRELMQRGPSILPGVNEPHGRDARATDARAADSYASAADFCLSVFSDNAGVIAFDETDAVCFKVETHNHPSAIEPYGGSATGVGGVIRDILGTGLAARPIANTDVFCVAFPDAVDLAPSGSVSASPRPRVPASIPKGVIHPKRILQQVVAGVRDYGNRMGIPTVNGAVYFDDRYIGNPLVFCGCVGLIPRDKIHKEPRAGDAIVVMGGRTGRDGIHGATFSSAELSDTHADEFAHAVQIGNAITEKKLADVILQARDRSLFTAITDCGAGGLSSAVGEMAEKLGATVELDRVPLKYSGLRYDEIWISEAQERMVLSVPPARLSELLELSASENVDATVIGRFGSEQRELVLRYQAQEVGRLSMQFLHEGLPMPARKAIVVEDRGAGSTAGTLPAITAQHVWDARATGDLIQRLLSLLAHPNVASKHWIIRQYDHEVQGGSVIKPLTGPLQIGPSDAAVIRPKLDGDRGIALGCGLAPRIEDPYQMALTAIDEAIRNVVAVGADPARIAILDNFCWPSVDDEATMGTLVRACEACRDAALAYRIPFISGKDSLHNQFTNTETGQVIRIPNTLLISAIGVIEDVRKCVTMDLKQSKARVYLIKATDPSDLSSLRRLHQAIAAIIRGGLIASCHDVSEGGTLVAAAEMCIASGLGMLVDRDASPFHEAPGQYLVEEKAPGMGNAIRAVAGVPGVSCEPYAATASAPRFAFLDENAKLHAVTVDELCRAWRGTLDW